MFIAYNVLLYFYIGYTYICWMNYRDGAGFDIHGFAKDICNDGALQIAVVLFWPVFILSHVVANLYDKFDLQKIVSKISPDAFYERGQHDDDINKQAEKHLLGGK